MSIRRKPPKPAPQKWVLLASEHVSFGRSRMVFTQGPSVVDARAQLVFALATALGVVLIVAALSRRARTAWPTWLPRDSALTMAGVLGAVVVFAFIAEEMVEGDTTSFDRETLLRIHQIDSSGALLVMRAFTTLASAVVVLPVTVLVVVWLRRRGAPKGAWILSGVALATELLNLALKRSFERARPSLFHEVATLHSYSFPSGHTMAATAIYGFAGYAVACLTPALRRPLAVAVPVLIILVGLSRVFLGVHWPTDVFAGFAAGTFILLAGILAARRGEPEHGLGRHQQRPSGAR